MLEFIQASIDGQRRTSLYAKAMLIRSVEQRQLQLFSEGKLFGTVHTCIGQEWTGIAIAEALQEGDLIYSNHRGHGHYLARTEDAVPIAAGLALGQELRNSPNITVVFIGDGTLGEGAVYEAFNISAGLAASIERQKGRPGECSGESSPLFDKRALSLWGWIAAVTNLV